MSQGLGRGGRGYGFDGAQKERTPGSSSEEGGANKMRQDLHTLSIGRGRSTNFARGSLLFSGAKSKIVLGRGSGAVLGSEWQKTQARVGISAAVEGGKAPPLLVRDAGPETPSGVKAEGEELSEASTASVSGVRCVTEDLQTLCLTDSGVFSTSHSREQPTPGETGASGSVQAKSFSKLEGFKTELGARPCMAMGRGLLSFGRGTALRGRGSTPFSDLMKSRNVGVGGKQEPTHTPQFSDPPGAERARKQPAVCSPQEISPGKPNLIGRPPTTALLERPNPLKQMQQSLQRSPEERSPGNLELPKHFPSKGMSGRGITLPRAKHGIPPPIGIHSLGQVQKPSAPVSKSVEAPHTTTVSQSVAPRDLVQYRGESSGMKLPVRVNCVRVKCSIQAMFQYHVSFDPDVDNRSMRFSLLNQHRELIGDTKAFDGSILFLPRRLPQDRTTLTSERVTDGTEVKMSIVLTKMLHPASHLLVPFYNVVLHRVMRILKMCNVGRNFYDPAGAQQVLKYKLDLWPGYVTAIREMEGGLMMNIDTSHKVLRNESVLSFMQDVYRCNKADFKAQCLKELLGSTVLTRYNNNNYRVDDIDWSMNPRSTFTTSKGETLSFYDYYKAQYGIDIKDLQQPLLVNRPKKATQRGKRSEAGEDRVISLVPELCFLTGISDKLAGDFSAMKDIGQITRLGPMERNLNIESFLQRVNSSPEAKKELQRWGLELESHCTSTEGRILPLEKVLVGGGKVFQCNEQVDFFRDISRSPVLKAVPILKWLLVFTRRDTMKAQAFASKLQEVSRNIQIQVRPPQFIELKDDRSETFKNAIASAISPDLQLVVCIFPTARDDRYSAIKRLCCVDMPVPSQVINSRTLPNEATAGKFRSVTMKIALQINCKLGGELWALNIPIEGLMVCGIDAYHEGRGRKGKSVAGLVASMNKLMTRWYSRAVLQPPQQELMDSLVACFCDTLTNYYKINHRLPEKIVIYRDGVGDGQFSVVKEHEVAQLRTALKQFDEMAGGEYSPKLTIVVVSKRINIRFLKQSGRSLMNPPPGTVLDHTATRPNWPDFYLVSQHVRQGTVSPTHYVVVEGSEFYKPDHLQRLTYKMTHMYYNWPGTVRVPAPCQYAHKLAYLVGENIRSPPSKDLCDRLFYL